MADCDWVILCDYAFPAMHGKLCLVGVFDLMFTPSPPHTHPRAFIAFSIVGEPGEKGEADLKIIGPSAQVIVAGKVGFTLPDLGSAFAAFEVQNLVLPEFGRYAIEIDFKESIPKQAWFTLQKTASAT
jgi:hypothetical protein